MSTLKYKTETGDLAEKLEKLASELDSIELDMSGIWREGPGWMSDLRVASRVQFEKMISILTKFSSKKPSHGDKRDFLRLYRDLHEKIH